MEETMLRKFSSQQYYKVYQNKTGNYLCTLFLKRIKSTIIKNSGILLSERANLYNFYITGIKGTLTVYCYITGIKGTV